MEEEGSTDALVKWRHLSLETITTKKGLEKKKLQLVYKKTTSDELVRYPKPKLQAFSYYTFVAKIGKMTNLRCAWSIFWPIQWFLS